MVENWFVNKFSSGPLSWILIQMNVWWHNDVFTSNRQLQFSLTFVGYSKMCYLLKISEFLFWFWVILANCPNPVFFKRWWRDKMVVYPSRLLCTLNTAYHYVSTFRTINFLSMLTRHILNALFEGSQITMPVSNVQLTKKLRIWLYNY